MSDRNVTKKKAVYLGCNGGALHLVQQLTNSLQIRDMCTVGIESTFTVSTFGQRLNNEFLGPTWVDLEMEFASARVLPELSDEVRRPDKGEMIVSCIFGCVRHK